MKYILPVFSLFVACAQFSFAQLVFESTSIAHEAADDETAFEAVFKFRNEGEKTVEIMKPKSSCGCTVPTLEKTVYEPGEEGSIRAVFTYGNRSGQQFKSITVPTSTGSHELHLKVNIPLTFEMDKRLLFWNRQNIGQTLEATATFYKNVPIELISDFPSNEIYDYELIPNEDNSAFTIRVTPNGTYNPGISRTDWIFRDATGTVHEVPLFLRLY